MAACCGVPPYTPDQLMEIVVTDSTVSTWAGTALARPRRLSPPEGFALAASARALLAVPGSDESGALSRALAKLDRALGGEEIAVELGAPALLPLVRDAARDGRRLAVSYYSASTDRVTDREIMPHRVFAADGPLVRRRLLRHGRRRAAVPGRPDRCGRVSRGAKTAGTSRRTDDCASGTAAGGGARPTRTTCLDFHPFVPGPDSRRVRLSIDPSTAWLVESIPSAGPPSRVDGRVELELFVGGDAWLERLLLRLGPDARVIDPPEYRAAGLRGRHAGSCSALLGQLTDTR